MSLHDDEKTRRKMLDKIVEDNSRWVDEQFGQVDMSDFVDFTKPGPEASFIDERYGQLDTTGTGLGAKALHEFLDNPDENSLAIAAEETGNPDLIDHVNEERAGKTAEQFIRKHPEYFPTDGNMSELYDEVARAAGLVGEIEVEELYGSGHFTLQNLEKAYSRLLKLGRLQLPEGSFRELSPEQLQYVKLLCSRGDIPGALVNFCQYALGEQEAKDIFYTHDHDPYRFLQNPAYQELFSSAVWFVFKQVQLDYVETAERKRFLEKYSSGRWLTVELLKQAWQLCKKSEEGSAKDRLLFGSRDEETGSEEFDFDSLTDEQIANLKSRTLQKHAQNIMAQKRRGRGI